MPAGIGEGAQLIVFIAHQQHRPARRLGRPVGAGVRHLVGPADKVPAIQKHPLALALEEGGRGIAPGGQGGCLQHRPAHGRIVGGVEDIQRIRRHDGREHDRARALRASGP